MKPPRGIDVKMARVGTQKILTLTQKVMVAGRKRIIFGNF